MFRKVNYSYWLKILVWAAVVLGSVGMAEIRLSTLRCENLVVEIDTSSGMHFISPDDVEMLLTNRGNDPLQGNRIARTNLNELENRVKSSPLVKDCDIITDLNGDLIVNVKQRTPIARFIQQSNGEWRKSNGYYIDDQGHELPLSSRFSASVLLVSGQYFNRRDSLSGKESQPVMDFLRYVDKSAFWKAQISQVFVNVNGNIQFTSTAGNQLIEFGQPERIESKFKKLLMFYNKVLKSDWNKYSRINVMFKNQVVCE